MLATKIDGFKPAIEIKKLGKPKSRVNRRFAKCALTHPSGAVIGLRRIFLRFLKQYRWLALNSVIKQFGFFI